MKRTLAILLAIMMLFSFAACANKPAETTGDDTAPTDPAAPEKTVINFFSFTTEVPDMAQKYIDDNGLADKYELNPTIVATTDGAYQPALDQALAAGEVDMYCAEAAFVMKYSQGDAADFAVPYSELGIEDVDGKIKDGEIAQYTVDIGTRDGDVVALAYQSTGSCFIYRDDVAQTVWGDEAKDNPDFVAEKIGAGTGSWDKFWEAAKECKAKGVAIVSGDGDIWHAIENSAATPWIVDGKLNIDPARAQFMDYSKTLYDEQYSNRTQDWKEQWFVDMGKTANEEQLAADALQYEKDLVKLEAGDDKMEVADGDVTVDTTFKTKPVLGFYGPAWLINYTIGANCGKDDEKGEMGTFGQWRVCPSNIGFLWGGTWTFAGQPILEDDAKKEFAANFIEWLTLDTSEDGLQYKWANGLMNDNGTKDSVASNVVMSKSDGKIDFLNGQDMFPVFQEANKAANGRVMTQYDEKINDYWRKATRLYVAGKCTKEEAVEKFIKNVTNNLDVDEPAE